MRCVDHVINVPSVSLTSLTSNVGTRITRLPSLTFSTTTLVKSSCTVCIVEAPGYTLPMTTRGRGTSPTNNLHL